MQATIRPITTMSATTIRSVSAAWSPHRPRWPCAAPCPHLQHRRDHPHHPPAMMRPPWPSSRAYSGPFGEIEAAGFAKLHPALSPAWLKGCARVPSISSCSACSSCGPPPSELTEQVLIQSFTNYRPTSTNPTVVGAHGGYRRFRRGAGRPGKRTSYRRNAPAPSREYST